MDLIRYIKVEFPKKGNRPNLSPEQMGFLQGFIPFSLVMNAQLLSKLSGRIRTVKGILPSVILADMIVRSDWGRLKPAEEWNNLGMLRKDSVPKIKHKTKKWDGLGKEEPFRVYESWYDFAIDMTDHYAFSGYYDELFAATNSDEQTKLMKKVYKLQNIVTYATLKEIIADYNLTEFDDFSAY